MDNLLLDSARELLADTIRESVKRNEKLTASEWETLLKQYEWVIIAATDDNPDTAGYKWWVNYERSRLAEIADKLILKK